MTFITVLLAALLGLVAGIVINWLADDLPEVEIKLRAPHHPDGSPRAWSGLWAFIRAYKDKAQRLSWRYPLVEIVTPLSFAAVVWAYPFNPEIIFYLCYVFIFVLVTVIDIEHRLILFVVMVPSGIIAILDPILYPTTDRPDLGSVLLGGGLGFGVFWLFWYGGVWFNRARAGEMNVDDMEVAFGFGDVMLATVCGLILGWQAMIFAMFITVFAGALGGIVWLASRMFTKTGYAAFAALPYGPYIIFGTVLMLFFTEPVKSMLWAFQGWFA